LLGLLEFQNVSKRYGDIIALDGVSFSVESGAFFSFLGPSGCGKTTLLRIVAGLEKPDSGRIFLDGEEITHLPPNKRPVNTVFQNYALFPHMTIWDNIAFGLKIEKRPKAEIDHEVRRMLKMIQMEEHAYKFPDKISGGQKQRVAIARALIKHPRLLLLDEPLSALDLKLRQKMLMEIDLIHDQVGITFLFVTHDQVEAMSVSDKIAVFHRGRIEQIGSPAQLYEAPKSSFVAAFIGDTNFLDGFVHEKVDQDYIKLKIEGFPDVLCFNDTNRNLRDLVHLSVRPEKIHISRKEPEPFAKHNVMPALVDNIIYKGDHTNFWVTVGEYRISITQQHSRFLLDEKAISWKEKVWIWWHADDGYMLERYHVRDEALTLLPPESVGSAEEIDPEDDLLHGPLD